MRKYHYIAHIFFVENDSNLLGFKNNKSFKMGEGRWFNKYWL